MVKGLPHDSLSTTPVESYIYPSAEVYIHISEVVTDVRTPLVSGSVRRPIVRNWMAGWHPGRVRSVRSLSVYKDDMINQYSAVFQSKEPPTDRIKQIPSHWINAQKARMSGSKSWGNEHMFMFLKRMKPKSMTRRTACGALSWNQPAELPPNDNNTEQIHIRQGIRPDCISQAADAYARMSISK